ncbi:hypothetical protein Tco_1563924 [Tanacetum coccineum]
MTTKAQQITLDNALVALENQCVIGKCNMRINPGMKPKEPTYQVVLDALAILHSLSLLKFQSSGCINFGLPEILNICRKIPSQEFDEPPSEEETLYFIQELSHSGEIMYHEIVSRHEDTQVYGALLPKAMANQAMLNSNSYKTYYAIATRAEPPKTKKTQKKSDSTISSEETPSKKKPTKAKKDVPSTKKPTTKLKPTKKKAPVKADRGKSDGTDFQSGVLNEQQRKISITDEGTGTKPGVPDVPKYDSESNKESWGDSGEEDDDDEDDTEDDGGNDDGDDSDGNDDDDNDGNDDDIDYKRTASDRDENPNINQSNKEHKEEEENVDKFTNEEDDAKEENKEELDNAEELYKDVNVNLRKEDEEEDAHVTLTAVHDAQKTEGLMQSSFVSYEFIKKLPKFKNVSPTDNEIAFLMDTTSHNLEKDLSEMKQVDQYAQAISSVPAIVDRYIDNKQREAIRQAIQPHTAECREEALADSKEYIDLIDTYVRAIIKEEVNSQLPHILPQVV